MQTIPTMRSPVTLHAVLDMALAADPSLSGGSLSGLDARGLQAPACRPISLDVALGEEHGWDAHAACYAAHSPAGEVLPEGCRLRKAALPLVRAAGADVTCWSVFVDLDLRHVLRRAEHVGWSDLTDAEATVLRGRFLAGCPAHPATRQYATEHGWRYVHRLALPVPAGSGYEELVASVVEDYHRAGLPADRTCRDWTRAFRLPRVTKESGLRTWEAPWFREAGDPDAALVPPESVLAPRDEGPGSPARVVDATRPGDDECRSLVYSDGFSALTAAAAKVERRFRGSAHHAHVFGDMPLADPGGRHDGLARLCGALVPATRATGGTLELAYALAAKAAALLDQDEDWAAKSWGMCRSFWSRPDAPRAAAGAPSTAPAIPADPADPDPADPDPAVPADDSTDPDDSGELSVDGDGMPYATPRNVRVAMRQLGLVVERDLFARRDLLHGPLGRDDPWRGHGPVLSDVARTTLQVALQERTAMKVSPRSLEVAVADASWRRRFHPVLDYLDALRWDGVPRVDSWLAAYLGAEPSDYVRAVGAIFLVAACRRVRWPGCKFDELLLLEGPQGSLKSTALRVLAVREDWFSDDLPLGVDAKQVRERTQGKWVVEAGELVGMGRRGVADLKSFLSRTHDTARGAYERSADTSARQFVIAGTTNSDQYLEDLTGNRRFWPVRTGRVDLDALRRDVGQLWAEASGMEHAGASTRLAPELYPAATAQQEERQAADPWADVLAEALAGHPDACLPCRDAYEVVELPKDRRGQRDAIRLGVVMRSLGFARVTACHWRTRSTKSTPAGDPTKCFSRGDGTDKVGAARGRLLPSPTGKKHPA